MPRYSAEDVGLALGSPVTLLGEGATADTWRCDDSAVKIICDPSYPAERLQREVTGLSRVNNHYVVQLQEVGQIVLDGNPHAYLRFEFIDGGDVAHRFNSGEWPATGEAISFLEGLLKGVDALHEVQVLHRDIKPANISLRQGRWDSPVLLDLGLARVLDQSSITFYPGQIGTQTYMSPEQLRGERARKASDLFALGVTVRQGIGRAHPFYQSNVRYSIDEAIQRIAAGPTPLPEGLSPDVELLLDRLVSPIQNERGSARSSLSRLGVL